MSNFAPKRTTYSTGDRRWLRNLLASEAHGVTVEYGDVTPDSNGLVKSGTLIPGEGLLKDDLTIKTGEKHLVSVIHEGTVDRRYLPAQLNQAQEAALKGIVFINGDAPQA